VTNRNLKNLAKEEKTLKTIFKSKSSKENDILNLQAAIEVATKDIEDFKKLINFLNDISWAGGSPKV